MKRTKIICTLGPAVDSDEAIEELIKAGMDVARLNFSHGSHAEHKERMDRIKRVRDRLNSPCAILLDTQGPEIRTGRLAGGEPVELVEGASITLTTKDIEGDATHITQSAINLPRVLTPGDTILIDDGLIGLKVVDINGEEIVCIIENAGTLGQRKSINVPSVSVPLPVLTEKDCSDLLFGIEQQVDYIAASFVRSCEDVNQIRRFLEEHGGGDIRIISKIENNDAVNDIENIIHCSDAIMVARGDLGVEVDAWRIPHIQKKIIRMCNRSSKPVITATQMLESMIRNPRPTRAEVTDVANAVYDGTDCVMLSGETALGSYPVQAVKMMVHVATESEQRLFDEHPPDRKRTHMRPSLAVGFAAVETAEKLNARCIVAPTMSGRTARLMSNLRPRVPIYAVTPIPRIMRQLQLSWGVIPMTGDVQGGMRNVIEQARATVYGQGYVDKGDLTVFTAGDPATSPLEDFGRNIGVSATNVMYVVEI